MHDINIAIMVIILAFGFLGIYAHFREVRKSGRTLGTFFDYLFADQPGKTGKTVIVYLTWMGGMWSTGMFDAVIWEAFTTALSNGVLYFPLANAVALSFMSGYTIDSKVNK